jgi:hypothetical protein
MISVFLMGRMGNNLFQIAAGLSLAKKHNTILYVPRYTWNPPNMVASSYLDCFELTDVNWVDRFINIKGFLLTYGEQKFSYNEEFEKLSDNNNLYGYYQSEKYFKSYEQHIRKNFKFKDEITNSTIEKLNKLNVDYKKATAIHVRRGDYVGLPDAYPLQDVEYYEKALNDMGSKDVIVFSDDIEWCKDNFKSTSINFSFADMNQQNTMCAMTMVSDLVIANSTFSWWGAWLNPNKNKRVYYPKKWFGTILPYKNSTLEETMKDLPCSNWIGL